MFTKKTTLLLLKILEKVTSDKALHSRWLNTLSYLEYIGTRKILKSLPAHIFGKTFLEHINEEARHSLFFKNLAQKEAQKNLSFQAHEMLAPQSASDYFQKVDHYNEMFSFSNPLLNYFYTTYTVEQRALVVYSLYNEILKRKGFSFSIQSVLNDEKAHLDFVFEKIQKWDPLWEKNLENSKHFEHQKYFSLLIALEQAAFDVSTIKNLHQFQKEQRPSYHQKI